MAPYLVAHVDKFVFKVAEDRLYTQDHLWLKPEGELVRLGFSDYLQQTSGDIAFAEMKPAGTALALQGEFGTVETIKVNLALTTPLSGIIAEVNAHLLSAPELINQAPYDDGWLILLAESSFESAKAQYLEPEAYFSYMKSLAEQEARRP